MVLFDLLVFPSTDAIVSSCSGGGSLIYANVMLPMDSHWFHWQIPGHPSTVAHLPATPRSGYAAVSGHAHRRRGTRMTHLAVTKKTQAIRASRRPSQTTNGSGRHWPSPSATPTNRGVRRRSEQSAQGPADNLPQNGSVQCGLQQRQQEHPRFHLPEQDRSAAWSDLH